MTYDDACWHYDSAAENGLETRSAATHIGMFMAWLAAHGLVNPKSCDVEPLLGRTATPGQFVLDTCGGEINAIWLTADGAAFTAAVYRRYLAAYRNVPTVARYDVVYAAPDTWDVYDAVAPAIDELYGAFSSA